VSSEQREAVVSAAGELFARFGLEKTTMEDIGAACHKAKSSLYYYFRSKEDIFAEVIRREIAGLQETILREMKREDDPYNRFRTFVMTKLTYLIETQNKYVTIREDYLRNYDFINSLTEEYCAWELNLIEGILSHGRDRGAFNVMDTKGTSRALYFAIKGIEYPWIVNFSKREIERGIDLLVDILLSGIHAI
jgi:AcrR family transcriptional regulator